ncbi:13403_t:CDS:2 [Entrophospora sp. SA101]|nr:13403_t:CDS:2 [Entrophospora sp. SA101]
MSGFDITTIIHDGDKKRQLPKPFNNRPGAWRNFKKRPESLAAKVWNAVRNDGTPDEEKFLGITTRKVKNLQTRDQFNLWRNNIITMYKKEKNFDMLFIYQKGYEYEEYYIPGDWISFKKHQLQQRLSNHLKELLKEQGYRVVCGRSWYVMVKWIENPDYYANLTYPNIVRI